MVYRPDRFSLTAFLSYVFPGSHNEPVNIKDIGGDKNNLIELVGRVATKSREQGFKGTYHIAPESDELAREIFLSLGCKTVLCRSAFADQDGIKYSLNS